MTITKMKLKLKIRFNSGREYFEKISSDTYLVYLKEPEGVVAESIIKKYLSAQISVNPSKMKFMKVDEKGNWIVMIE
jgi:hypothetical protein